MGGAWWRNLVYLAAAVMFITALRMLSSPRTARAGNLVGACGMFAAVLATVLGAELRIAPILIGIGAGAAAGAALAVSIRMTAMPQMVALLNGFGGAASALVGAVQLVREGAGEWGQGTAIALSVLIGTVTFTGSVTAFAKLQGLIRGRPITYGLQQPVNLAAAVAALVVVSWLVREGRAGPALWILAAVSAFLGVAGVLPIGGADMPVVISLLNSWSGLAATAAGFVLLNNGLIISGSLVGASGFILTALMCRAMNRSLANVLFGAFGKTVHAAGERAADSDRTVRSGTVEDAAVLFEDARKVIVVPGYGLAVAQAQHAVRALADTLQARGIEVRYAIHPVAGRMPGHMNVLLAEANVPYEQMVEMEKINPEFPEADIALVVGANDVTNPAARNRPDSPLYGMPILDVDRARSVIVIKRSMNPGFAGIENDLYHNPRTMMLFGDAREMVARLNEVLRGRA